MRKLFFFAMFWFLTGSAFGPVAFCLDAERPSGGIDIVLNGDGRAHNFKNPYDLHNLSTALLGMMEVEVLRMGDYLIDLPRQGPDIRPFDRTADKIQEAYRLIPQVKPVSRFGQFVDALQIRQFNLSDLRMVPAAVTSGAFRPSPNMQTRAFKLLQFLQDVLNDLDRLMMAPVDDLASRASRRPVRLKALGFAGDGVEQVRKAVFKVFRTVNKKMVETASDGIDWIEIGIGKAKWRGENKKAQAWIVYLKMPASSYERERKFFDRYVGEIYVGSPEEWRNQLISQQRAMESLLRHAKRGWRPYSDVASTDEVLIATRLRCLKKAPDIVRDYIIDSDEFDALVFGKPSPRAHLKIVSASL